MKSISDKPAPVLAYDRPTEEQIFEYLRDEIIPMQLLPGETIPETQLADLFHATLARATRFDRVDKLLESEKAHMHRVRNLSLVELPARIIMSLPASGNFEGDTFGLARGRDHGHASTCAMFTTFLKSLPRCTQNISMESPEAATPLTCSSTLYWLGGWVCPTMRFRML